MCKKIFSSGLMAILLLATAISFAQEQAKAPIYKDGDSWQFGIGKNRYEVTISGGKLTVFELKPEGKVEAEGERADLLSAFIPFEKDDMELLQFPLVVGKKWTARFDTGKRRVGKRTGTVSVMKTAETEVIGIEEVTTPAGSFKAFKVERVDTQSRGKGKGSKLYSEFIYYSPDTRSVVKYDYEGAAGGIREVNLVKFGSQN
jgi:hypothetical protein